MKTVILCGGQGTRIRDVSSDVPKPMLPIGGRPILWHIMKIYAAAGHQDFVLCLGYKAHVIKEFFLNYQAYTNDLTVTLGQDKAVEYHSDHDETGWQITLADTGIEAMTGARVKRIQKYIGDDDTFMLTYGDGVSNVDIAALLEFHNSHGKMLTVTGVRPPSRFGEIDTAEDGQVTEFNEKPQSIGGRISGGFFVCNRKIFEHLNDSEDLVLEQEPMRQLAEDGEMMLYEHNDFWQCMDTNRDYNLLNGLWGDNKAPWRVW
jgi:glucose-1-phosphate cytidylyltransferase